MVALIVCWRLAGSDVTAVRTDYVRDIIT